MKNLLGNNDIFEKLTDTITSNINTLINNDKISIIASCILTDMLINKDNYHIAAYIEDAYDNRNIDIALIEFFDYKTSLKIDNYLETFIDHDMIKTDMPEVNEKIKNYITVLKLYLKIFARLYIAMFFDDIVFLREIKNDLVKCYKDLIYSYDYIGA